MKNAILISIAVLLLNACSGGEECIFCAEWVLVSSNGEELIDYNKTVLLNADGTFEFRDTLGDRSGTWATFNNSQKITFHHRDWHRTVNWTNIVLSGDTMFAVAGEELDQVLVRKTPENAAVLEAGLTRIDHFKCAVDSNTISIPYTNSHGRKKQLELTTYCAKDKFITIKDPFKKNKGTERHFYHYSNTAAVIRFISGERDESYPVSLSDFPDSLLQEGSGKLLLKSISHEGYRVSREANFFLATLADTSYTKKKSLYFFMDEEGHLGILGPNIPPPDFFLRNFDIPLPIEDRDELDF